MNSLRNSVRLIGNLGANPEIRELDKGKKMAKFSLATSESYKDADGNRVNETQWHNIVVWGKQADFAAQYLEKGQQIALEGKLLTRTFTDKEGNKRYFTEITANEILKTSASKSE
jgi:single-strand DNA-binding protein